jgi:uncharacterized protein
MAIETIVHERKNFMNHGRIFMFVMLVACSLAAKAQPTKDADPATVAAARELLEMSGGGKLGARVIEQIISSFKQKLPAVPDSIWDDLGKQLNGDDLVTLALPVYTKHFTVQEMKAIMTFYKTPAGAKLVESMPDITQGMSRVGQEWGKTIGQKVVQRLQEKGYLKSSDQK